MIARRARPRFRVRIEVSHAGGWRAWGAVAGAFEQRLAAQVSPAVSEARVDSEVRRGPDLVRVRVQVTVAAADLGQAAVIAWDVLRVAIGDDAPAWNTSAASAEIEPAAGPSRRSGPTSLAHWKLPPHIVILSTELARRARYRSRRHLPASRQACHLAEASPALAPCLPAVCGEGRTWKRGRLSGALALLVHAARDARNVDVQ
jgi:hypothetical protein